ncbi:MAG: sulfite exporter TauE/SafE family protein [Thiohalobacteraceae bacterium]|nr:sulfite exporter TauE/SafE family protein [Gammaproteobacteria bacterium]
MLTDVSLLSALLVGLFGGVHCVAMCGGIVGALTLGVSGAAQRNAISMLPYHLAYNLGRIISYTLAGALVGGLSGVLFKLTSVHQAQMVLQLFAGLFMLALGLYLAGWWRGLAHIERAGGVFWRRLEPLGRRFLPVTSPAHAFGVGLVWGWLPCGLVYSVLVWALASGSALDGALLLLSFGIGTLPTLLLMGVAAARLGRFVQRPWPRRIAGGLVMLFGVMMLLRLFSD